MQENHRYSAKEGRLFPGQLTDYLAHQHESHAISSASRRVPVDDLSGHEPQAHGTHCELAQYDPVYVVSLVIATFIVPPGLALLMANLFRLPLGETAGLFLVGVAPGAPLLTRNLARRGFDMHLAASYQVWAALMVPIMIPLLVAAAGKLYGRDIWIPPLPLLKQIIEKQFLPLAVGMVIGWIAPKISQRSQPILNVAGNVVLTVMIVAVLFKMRSELESVSPL